MKNAHDILEKLATGKEFRAYRFNWSPSRKRFSSISTASVFFIHVMLDKLRKGEGSWTAAEHFVTNQFPNETIWDEIKATHLNSLTSICLKGNNGGPYAVYLYTNKFPEDLKKNAKIMVSDYGSDPRNIWNVTPENVELIYTRFMKFHGIADALAKMAQFELVRDYGVAGSKESKQYLKAKPDIHVSKVLYRMGLSQNETPRSAVNCIEKANVSSQADLDAVLFKVGHNFCLKSKPLCDECPLKAYCDKKLK